MLNVYYILDERIVMGMKVDQQLADQVTLALGIGGMIDHAEEHDESFTYVTDDGRVLKVDKSGFYTLRDMDEKMMLYGSVEVLLRAQVGNWLVFEDRLTSLVERWRLFLERNPEVTDQKAIQGFMSEINDGFTKRLMEE
jgi:hypothetical protein